MQLTRSFHTIHKLDLFCKEQGKWTKVPYVPAFTALNQDPDPRASCRMCLTTNEVNKPPLDILDGDCLNRPIPPHKLGLLEDHWPIQTKRTLALLLSFLLINHKTPLLPGQLDIPGMGLPISQESHLRVGCILLGKLLTEKWAPLPCAIFYWQTWLK